MAPLSDSAPKTQSVLTETYGELEILVPEAFSEYSPELLENQKRAIDLGAVLAEDVKTARADYLYLGWVFEQPRHWCWHLNIPPVRREELRATYPTYHFPSLVERKGFIVAGVFAVLTSESWAFRHPRFNKYIGIEWTCFQKLSLNHLTYLPLHPDRYKSTLETILRSTLTDASCDEVEQSVKHWATNLELYRRKDSVPTWWPLRLSYQNYVKERLGKDDLIHVAACVLFQYEDQVSEDVKNQKLWTAMLQEPWKKYKTSSLSDDPWQNTSTFAEPHQKRQRVEEESMTPSNMDEVKDIIRGIRSTITQSPTTFDEYTKATHAPIDKGEFSKSAEGTTFKVSNTEQLKLFYSSRLSLLPKKLLARVMSLWRKKLGIRQIVHVRPLYCSNDIKEKLTLWAADLLLAHHGATEDSNPKLQTSWIKDFQANTESLVADIPTQYCSDPLKRQVQREALPSLFYVAQLYEALCQLKSKGGSSEVEIIIWWRHIHKSKEEKKGMEVPSTGATPPRIPSKRYASSRSTSSGSDDGEDIHTWQVPRRKRQRVNCVREGTGTQCDSTLHKPTNSPTLHSSQASLGPHQLQIPGWEQTEQKPPDYPYEALQHRIVKHEDANAPVATSSESANNMTMQPNYTNRFNIGQHDCNNLASYGPIHNRELPYRNQPTPLPINAACAVVPTPWAAPPAATTVTENENIQPAQEAIQYTRNYGQFQDIPQAYEDNFCGRPNDVEIQRIIWNLQRTTYATTPPKPRNISKL